MEMTSPLDRPASFSRSYLGYALVLLAVVNVVNYMDRSIIGVLIQPMKADLALSDTQVGLMTGFAFALFYAIAGIYLAHLADIHNRVRIMAWCVAIWSAMTALSGAAQNFTHLLVARVGVGIGEASVIPTANAMIADYHRPERRAFALAVFTAGSMTGVMAGSLLGGWVAETWSWRWAFVIAALPGIPLALLVRYTLRDPVRGGSDPAGNAPPVAFGAAMRMILQNRAVLLLIAGFAFIVFMLFGVITWFPAFLVRVHGMTLSQVGTLFGLAMGLGTIVGAVGGGWLASVLTARDLGWLTRLPPWLLFLMWPLYELAIYAPSGEQALIIVALVAAVGGAAYGPALAALQTALPANARAKGAALNGFVGSLVGIGGGPLAVGMLSDHFAPALGEAAALQQGLAIAVCAGLFGVVFMALAHQAFMRQQFAAPTRAEGNP
jgi:predicted MFS family arabinose efflux permease